MIYLNLDQFFFFFAVMREKHLLKESICAFYCISENYGEAYRLCSYYILKYLCCGWKRFFGRKMRLLW